MGVRQLADPAVLRIWVKSLAVSLLLTALLGAAGWWGLDWLLAREGLGDGAFAWAGPLRQAAAGLLALFGLWLAWRVVAIAVLQFFADEVVLAVERRHYPAAAAKARDLPLAEQTRVALASAARALGWNLAALPVALLLLITGIGPALVFFAVNAVLLGRELADMAWLRHAHAPGAKVPLRRGERLALGAVVTGMLMLPFVNLLAPLLGAASATHLLHRRLAVAGADA